MSAALGEQATVIGAGQSRQGAFTRYLAALFVASLAGAGLLLAIGGSSWYLTHGVNPGLRIVGYSEWMRPKTCQVVLYGDSSAMTGFDPAIIEARTGLTACNLAEGTAVLNVVGTDLPLQAYLKKHPAPRFIVGMWTPSIFNPEKPPFTLYSPEGIAYALRYMRSLDLLKGLLRNPKWILQFYSDFLDDVEKVGANWLHGRQLRDVRRERTERGGQWMLPLPPETECVRTKMHYNPDDFPWKPESAPRFREKYSSPRTRVIMDVSPVPDCDALYEVYAHRLAGWHDNAFTRLPIRFFNDSDVHFSPEGSRYMSEQIAGQILAAGR